MTRQIRRVASAAAVIALAAAAHGYCADNNRPSTVLAPGHVEPPVISALAMPAIANVADPSDGPRCFGTAHAAPFTIGTSKISTAAPTPPARPAGSGPEAYRARPAASAGSGPQVECRYALMRQSGVGDGVGSATATGLRQAMHTPQASKTA